MPENKCRICGRGLTTGAAYMPDPLLPGDLPAHREVCNWCDHDDLPAEPYTPPWAHR